MNSIEIFGINEKLFSPESPVPPKQIEQLQLIQLLVNYEQYVLLQKENGKKYARKLNQTKENFWLEIETIFAEKTQTSFLYWFYQKYFTEEIDINTVHQMFSKIIYPQTLAYSAFYKFIVHQCFIQIRSRKTGLATTNAINNLKKRKKAHFSPEALSKRSIKGWETRRKKLTNIFI